MQISAIPFSLSRIYLIDPFFKLFIFDARTKNVVGNFKDEHGNLVSGSKYIEVHFQDGKVFKMGNEFGLGRAHLG